MKPLFPDITVNGEIITSAEIAAEAQNHNAPRGKPGLAWRAAARALVIRALLLQEAARLDLKAQPEQVAKGKQETPDEALIRALLDTEIEPDPVTEEACRAIYDKNPGGYRSPSLFQPAHILYAARPEDKEARQAALNRAQAALATLKGDPKAFADLAKTTSDCPSRDNGGMLGQIGSGDTVPEFEVVLDTLEAGHLHPDPVETRFGIHIIRMDEKAPSAVLPFAAARDAIYQALEQNAWAQAANALTQKLVDQADIDGIDLSKPVEAAA
jgi:peptidyl-prolyl cis-trans isomerase C